MRYKTTPPGSQSQALFYEQVYECNVDQAGTGVRCYISARQTFRLQLPGGSTFLSEMTS